MSLTKEEFNRIYKLDPTLDKASHKESSFANLRGLLHRDESSKTATSIDVVTFYKRYKKHVYIRKMINSGIDAKYVKKENRPLSLLDYILEGAYTEEETFPESSREYYFWGENSEKQILDEFNTFKRLCEK